MRCLPGCMLWSPRFWYKYVYYRPKQPAPPIPLKDVRVEVTIRDLCASVTIHQTFINVEENPIEAVYTFPLEEKSAVTSFVAFIDGKKIKGVIQEKEEARNTYDDAIASGHGAYKIEEKDDEPNVFTVNIGNLPPGKEATIAISYATDLYFEEGLLKWRLATTNDNPSYFAAKEKSMNVPDLKLTVNLDMTSRIKKISSPTHPVTFELGEEPTQATVILQPSPPDVPPQDFIMLTQLVEPHLPCSKVAANEQGKKAMVVALYPNLELSDDEDVCTELVFLVDRSNSMSGSRIQKVKDTLEIFLRSLSPGTRFNIIGFGSRTQHLFKTGSVDYNDANLEIATAHVRSMLADLDGTDVLKPLKEVLETKPKDGYARQLFILTDGQVANTIECVNYVRKHADTTRVFTFGIGSEASPELVKGLARAGEGHYEFIRENDAMEEKVMRQLNRAMQPALTNIQITWKGIKVRQSPHRMPPLFGGNRLLLYAFPQEGEKQTGQVDMTIRAKRGLKPFVVNMKIDLDQAIQDELFHKLGAKAIIKDLVDGRSYFHDPKGNPVPGKNIDQEMLRLSLDYGVLCKRTAFVAVEEREEATEGTMQIRKIPITFEKAAEYNAKREQEIREVQRFYGFRQKLRDHVVYDGTCNGKTKQKKMKKKSRTAELSAIPPPARAAMPPPPAGMPTASFSALSLFSKRSGVSGDDLGEGEYSSDGEDNEEVEYGEELKSGLKLDRSSSLAAPGSPLAPPAPNSTSYQLSQPEPEPSQISQQQAVEKEEPEAVTPPPLMRQIIVKQKASGSWEIADVATLLGVPLDQLLVALPAGLAGNKVAEQVWATAVASAYLKMAFPDQKVNWELVVRKAARFVVSQAKSLPATEWNQAADDYVKQLVGGKPEASE